MWVGVLAMMALAGCTGDPAPVVTQVVTDASSASAEAPSPTPSPSPSPVVSAGLATPVDLFASGVGFTVAATQTADSSTDADGKPVSYDAINVTDGDPATAWRKSSADWSGDDYILITFDEPVKLTQVGLIPGYAKIDPSSGTDRFTQNHRLAWATWTFSDGSTWEQEFVSKPTMQTVPVAGEVTWVRVGGFWWADWDETPPATRDFLAISDVSLVGAPAS